LAANTPRAVRKKKHTQPDTPNLSATEDAAFEAGIEAAAKKMNWNRVQVKAFLKRVAETPELLSLAQKQCGELPTGDQHELTVEPKYTRTTAK